MDFTLSYVTDCLENAKFLTLFEEFVVRGQGLEFQGQGLVNWSSRTTTLVVCRDMNISEKHIHVFARCFCSTSCC